MARPKACDKTREEKKNQIVDAAVSCWQQHPEKIPSMAEVAKEANVAKGTVYLYFKCKEDLLLAAHERHVHAFFSALAGRASAAERMVFDDVMQLARTHILDVPAFLPLATLVAGLMHKGVSPEVASSFEAEVAAALQSAGELLCRHFPLFNAIEGSRLLMRSYALILGLWQLVGSERSICQSPDLTALLLPDYSSELEAALRALWAGTRELETK